MAMSSVGPISLLVLLRWRKTLRRFSVASLAAVLFGAVVAGPAAAAEPPARAAQPPAPEAAPAKPSLTVAVDPRVELLSLIFRLAGNPEYSRGRVPGYNRAVDERFGKFADHEVVEMARRLRATRGVSYDAVMSMAVHVSDAAKLEPRVPLDPRPACLDSRWRPEEAAGFLGAARQFVKDTAFEKFIADERPLYELSESRLEAMLKRDAHLEWFDEFFGQRPLASFKVVPGMLNGGGCYGVRFAPPGADEELYCILGVWSVDAEGKPAFDASMVDTVVHEFCHSYSNAVVDRHAEQLQKAGETLFPGVARQMQRQAYGNWRTMMYESLVRACVIRYTRRHSGQLAGWWAARQEQGKGFLWMPELVDLLGQYEADREKYPTLDAFAPRLVEFFDGYAAKAAEKQKELEAKRPKVVSVTPADGATDVDPALAEIKVVFDRPMQDGSWSLVGGGPNFPELAGKPSYDKTGTVWTVAVKLKPAWQYQFMLNSDRFQGFRSRGGAALEPVKVSFRTKGQ